ncbi:MAG: SH3 domain-containing protein, partial [Anaerolineales bacterium]|nr:SH3 domain-containing protein [Anaerolineales bacterium]
RFQGTPIIMILVFLAGCQGFQQEASKSPVPEHLTPIQSDTPLPATVDPVIIPTPFLQLDAIYTVVGIPAEGFLNYYQDPSSDSALIGQIPTSGTSLKPAGEYAQIEGTSWALIEYQGNQGWVDAAFLAEQRGQVPEELIKLGQSVVTSLKSGQYGQLEGIIHPEKCLRFSPYPFINDFDLTICPSELSSQMNTETTLTWGQYDGTGLPINLTFKEYHQKFVYDENYYQPTKVGFNVEIGSGNSINNIPEIYPDGIMIEYHFPGSDPRYGGMDWRSLRLVFLSENEHWYLTSIIHCEWTI